ncbi:MAG: amylo-alpha-1,6-glucosidase [Methylobacter sp.]|uniref:amylo-alpha-1,6-glucosidase n=1 Tax=Methylobacter sp. TaxID=2051955 RepID=UPI0025906873|nr:amylo-alpha-1,6-glucosidase [Methylobacter sp.]MCL7419680.1 amylo-alpha-1,6-glucosidase [Methylobacter sp.]
MTHLALGRGLCSDFEHAVAYEWLVTNGIGGFACGTVAEAHTRRYHGLLTAALTPPTGRTLLVSKLDIAAHYRGRDYALFSNEFADGTITPEGFMHLESFRLDRGLPVWRYAIADALIEKRIIMQPGNNTTLINIRLVRASENLSFTLTPLCTHRDYHNHSHGGWNPETCAIANGFEVKAFPGARRYRVSCEPADFTLDPVWYWRFKHRQETARGLDDTEDLFRPGYFSLTLAEGGQATVALTDGVGASVDFEQASRQIHDEQEDWLKQIPADAPDWIRQLALAAGQFIVDRRQHGQAAGKTIIAGYPWFTDWGRDAMIALPGLTLALGRFDIAAEILRTLAEHISAGMLPNRFPDQDSKPEYNTADATLWFIHAIDQYTQYSGDDVLAAELYPVLTDIIDWHRKGTRYGIRVDEQDGLLTTGETGMQLTWMDAKVGDWVVTPRIGKCVEINALWYNALKVVSGLARQFGSQEQADDYQQSALRVKNSFRHFWNKANLCLYDVIDGPEGDLHDDDQCYDGRLRPNQLLAVSLPHSPLCERQCKAIVDLCARELLTPFGLRSLAAGEPDYAPRYQGNPEQRDGAYHQGTVWAWLIGPFIDAHYRVYQDAEKALSFLDSFRQHLNEAGLGQVSEIFDAEPPFTARGCFAQAWSVGEILRVWLKFQASPEIQAARQDTVSER